jgi:flavin-binding protein dodecin
VVGRPEVFGGALLLESVGRRIRGDRKYVRREVGLRLEEYVGPLRGGPRRARVEVQAGGRGGIVSDHVYRLSEIVGSSPTSVDDAIRTAIGKAAQTVRNIEWFQAEEIRGQVVDGEVAYFQVTLKIGFRVE